MDKKKPADSGMWSDNRYDYTIIDRMLMFRHYNQRESPWLILVDNALARQAMMLRIFQLEKIILEILTKEEAAWLTTRK